MSWESRRAGTEDAESLAETMAICFDGYREFAPAGWAPPDFRGPESVERFRTRLGDPVTWAWLAQDAREPAGHVGFFPLVGTPGSAHLWQLFVRPPWWGSGLAQELLGAAMAEARAQGYRRMRLFTPEGQARARVFYERQGFELVGLPALEPTLGFDLVQYARGL